MAGSFDAGRSPTSDKTNDCLGLAHGEGNAILKCSLVEHCHERILAADCDEVPWQLISRRGILRSAARRERSVTAYRVHSQNQPSQHSLRPTSSLETPLRRHAALPLGSGAESTSSLVTASSCFQKYHSDMETGSHLPQVPTAAEAPVHAIPPVN